MSSTHRHKSKGHAGPTRPGRRFAPAPVLFAAVCVVILVLIALGLYWAIWGG